MKDLFRFEVATSSGGYSFEDSLDNIIYDVESEFQGDTNKVNKIKEWALNSKENEAITVNNVTVTNIG